MSHFGRGRGRGREGGRSFGYNKYAGRVVNTSQVSGTGEREISKLCKYFTLGQTECRQGSSCRYFLII